MIYIYIYTRPPLWGCRVQFIYTRAIIIIIIIIIITITERCYVMQILQKTYRVRKAFTIPIKSKHFCLLELVFGWLVGHIFGDRGRRQITLQAVPLSIYISILEKTNYRRQIPAPLPPPLWPINADRQIVQISSPFPPLTRNTGAW